MFSCQCCKGIAQMVAMIHGLVMVAMLLGLMLVVMLVATLVVVLSFWFSCRWLP